MIAPLAAICFVFWSTCSTTAFTTEPLRYSFRHRDSLVSSVFSSSQDVSPFPDTSTKGMLNEVTDELCLRKPLGIVLEEVEEGQASGVFVKEVSDAGSAADYADQILGAKISTIQGEDVSQSTFDAIMELIINAPDDDVKISVFAPEERPIYNVGDVVSVIAQQDGKEDINIDAKVGDNLRQVLIENGFEVYQGLKQTLGNCGGAGQCTFCAVDFLNSDGWEPRSDYEDQKLARFPGARLSCLNNIQGPVTLKKTRR